MQKKFHLNIKGKSNYTCKDVTSKHDHELYVLVMVSSTDECLKIIFNLRSFHRIFVFKSNPLMNNTDHLIGNNVSSIILVEAWKKHSFWGQMKMNQITTFPRTTILSFDKERQLNCPWDFPLSIKACYTPLTWLTSKKRGLK